MTDRRTRDYVYAKPPRRVDTRPTSPAAAGREGDYHADAHFLYLFADGQWRRVAWDKLYGSQSTEIDGANDPAGTTGAPAGSTTPPEEDPGWPDIDDINLPQHDHSNAANGGSSLKPSSVKIAAGDKEYADSTNGWLYASYK